MTNKRVLHITTSPRAASYSKGLSTAITDRLLSREVIDLTERDLTKSPPPFPDELLTGAFYKDPATLTAQEQSLLRYADAVVADVSQADIIVIGTPMYNLGMPAVLKAWIDQLVRFGVTYDYDENFRRKCRFNGKTIYLAIASGGRLADWPQGTEFIAAPVEAAFNAYVGTTTVRTFRVEGTAMPGFQPDYQQILADF
ncbi:FMN-dependent NADH-azoreductase [Chitinophaga sp. Cy-1792]|uniref:FMN-dependent NADH-azoreductase n=1 Tax=Chitinophaga sp. Cy-1792 TaxID=2608339 RepID=UPI00141E6C86|nr:NAD(P)H-dependent oxidoreductase [Chitinophaga sp. Cy-1792]NIG55760.1 NAD(P)H-dependent oxidoreductase [Chitinophaga sp. Cy-1792]